MILTTTIEVEPEVRPAIVIEPTETEEHLSEMVTLVREGFWCRDWQYNNVNGRMCAHGLMLHVLGYTP